MNGHCVTDITLSRLSTRTLWSLVPTATTVRGAPRETRPWIRRLRTSTRVTVARPVERARNLCAPEADGKAPPLLHLALPRVEAFGVGSKGRHAGSRFGPAVKEEPRWRRQPRPVEKGGGDLP